MIRTYYTLEDIINKLNAWDTAYDTGNTTTTTLFKSFLVACGFTESSLPTELKSTMANELWVVNIVGKYRDMYAVYTDDRELSNDDIKAFAVKLMHIFNDTYFKYNYMIGLYNDSLSSLMDGVTATSESKFNDTPQNAQGVYDWSTDDHLTNVSKNITSSDMNTKMARINEIQDSLRDLYSDWANEFRRIFIYGI